MSVAALQGCNAVTDDPGPCHGNNSFTLSFKMLTEDPLQETRSDENPNHSEVNSEYRDLEDGISRNDIGLFIFAKAPEGTDENLILKLTNIGGSTNPQMMITGSPGAYTITMAFDKSEFSDKIGYEINPNGDKQIQFRILILANCNPADNGSSWDKIDGITYAEVISKATDLHFAMSRLFSSSDGDSDVTGLYKGNIPMFGTNVFTVREIDLWSSKAEERIYLGEVDMLRALAKVRVVDNIQNKDDDGYPKITLAEFIGSQNTAYSLPAEALNYKNGNQVHTPNIFEPERALSLEDAPIYKLGTIPDGWNITSEDARKGQTRIGYIPEQKIGYLNNNVEEGFPIFRVTADVKEYENGVPRIVSKTYDVPMKAESGSVQDQDSYILRNHIYTLSVNKVGLSTPADITLLVDDWTMQEVNLVYTDNVTASRRIDWDNESYDSFNRETGEVYVKPFYG